jgi:hypothetical protein
MRIFSVKLVINRRVVKWFRGWRQLLCGSIYLVGLLPLYVQAESTTETYYKASVPVSDQSESERLRALREGLQQVLVRISGQTSFADNIFIQEALANPETYVRQFGYTSLANTEKTGSKTAVKQAAPMAVNTSFVPNSVSTLLRRAQLPIWPVNRPSVLAWVVADAGNGKQMINQVDGAREFLIAESARRGLPLVMPMNDLNDQVALDPDRLWNLDQTAVGEASKRYGEDSILAGKVVQVSPGQWQGNWLYLLNGQSITAENTSETLEAFLATGIELAVQTHVQRYGMNTTDNRHTVEIGISGVDTLKRYTDVLSFLKKLEIISAVKVLALDAGSLQVSVEISGDGVSLQEMIGLGRLLLPDVAITRPEESSSAQNAMPVVAGSLHYHYVGP